MDVKCGIMSFGRHGTGEVQGCSVCRNFRTIDLQVVLCDEPIRQMCFRGRVVDFRNLDP